MSKQTKSKDRIREHGEVYTNEREVNAMLDLVKPETEKIESTFLEPACGNGNFLAEILNRKLKTAKEICANNKSDLEIYSILAISSIYGIDILEDNVKECRERLFEIWQNYIPNTKPELSTYVKKVLKKNIICGNTLECKASDGTPLKFTDWQTYEEVKLEDMIRRE